MTTSAIPTTATAAAWDEPEGVAARGTLVVLPGRGETAAAYGRFGRRISADAYRVRVVHPGRGGLAEVRAAVAEVLADETLPAPLVLVGSDTGAAYATVLAVETERVDAVVLAGLVLPGPAAGTGEQTGDWEGELEARTACPAHRRVLSEDPGFERGALAAPLPAGWDELRLAPSGKPTLVVHGSADPLTSSQDAFEPFRGVPRARLRLVVGGRHDVLNDVSHRSVAATVVLFLESLKLGGDLPVIVGQVQG